MRGKAGFKNQNTAQKSYKIDQLEANINYAPSEIALEIDREATTRVNEQHLFSRGRLLFCVFAFVFTAVLTFLLTQNMRTSQAASAADFKAGNLLADSVMVVAVRRSILKTWLPRLCIVIHLISLTRQL